VPFEGWWQVLRLTPAVVYGGLAYAFLAKGSGRDRGAPLNDEAEPRTFSRLVGTNIVNDRSSLRAEQRPPSRKRHRPRS
jgi:hypothetical protein